MYVDNIEVVKIGPIRLFKALLDQLKTGETINKALAGDAEKGGKK